MFNSTVKKPYTVNWRNNLDDILSDIEDDSDNELPLSSIADFGYPFNSHKIEKGEVPKCKTVDCQTKQNINQENKSSHPSTPDVLHSVGNFKIVKSESYKHETVDYQTEQNNNQDNELPLSSIDKTLIKYELQKFEPVNCQSKLNIDNTYKSDPNKIICNKVQSTIDNQTRKYECDICSKIFSKRSHIIKHFKTSLCYPAVIYFFDNV